MKYTVCHEPLWIWFKTGNEFEIRLINSEYILFILCLHVDSFFISILLLGLYAVWIWDRVSDVLEQFCLLLQGLSQGKVKISHYDRRSVGQSVFVSSPSWGPRRYFLLSDNWGFVDAGRLLCWDDEYVICRGDSSTWSFVKRAVPCGYILFTVLYVTLLYRYVQYIQTYTYIRARGSVGGWGTMLQVGSSKVRFPMKSLDFSIDLILPAAIWPRG
jgi:hypothetical protein